MTNERRISRHALKRADPDELRALDAQSEEDIARAVADDPDAPPLRSKEWWQDADYVEPRPKTPVSLRLDTDIVEHFKAQGPGYQTRINAVLRSFVEHDRKAS